MLSLLLSIEDAGGASWKLLVLADAAHAWLFTANSCRHKPECIQIGACADASESTEKRNGRDRG